ncbi:hypothetical protein Bca101_076254 [Brassica carinata]
MRTICMLDVTLDNPDFSKLCWRIWIARNNLIFEKRFTTIDDILQLYIMQGNGKTHKHSTQAHSSHYAGAPQLPPVPIGSTYCTTDAALSSAHKRAGISWIMSSPMNSLLSQESRTFGI